MRIIKNPLTKIQWLSNTNINFEYNLPNRVLITKFKSITINEAAKELVQVDIVFHRNDEWRLGASRELENDAYNLWKKEWLYFQRAGEPLKPIKDYTKENEKEENSFIRHKRRMRNIINY